MDVPAKALAFLSRDSISMWNEIGRKTLACRFICPSPENTAQKVGSQVALEILDKNSVPRDRSREFPPPERACAAPVFPARVRHGSPYQHVQEEAPFIGRFPARRVYEGERVHRPKGSVGQPKIRGWATSIEGRDEDPGGGGRWRWRGERSRDHEGLSLVRNIGGAY